MLTKIKYIMLSLGLVAITGTSAIANKDVTNEIAEGCKLEISTYCNNVVPGQSRMLACFYAHSDKLSSQCETSLYEGAAKLKKDVSLLTYAINECAGDIKQFCSKVKIGERRIFRCLKENGSRITAECTKALDQTNLD